MATQLFLLICIGMSIVGSQSDLEWVWSSISGRAADICDGNSSTNTNSSSRVGFWCSCEYSTVSCRELNISQIIRLELPDRTVYLDLSYNSITSFLENSLSFSPGLYQLNLSHNNISNITLPAFNSVPNIKNLDLSHNYLRILPLDCFSELKDLESLQLHHNQLTALDSSIFPMKSNLIRLDLSYNPFQNLDSVEPSPLHRLTSLQYLDLTNCSLHRLHVSFLNNNSNIVELRLSKNLIDYIPTTTLFDTRASIEFLDLTGNPVELLPNHGFHGLFGLKTLIVNDMPKLRRIEALAFHDLHSLERLECENNPHLEYIHPQAFRDNLDQELLARVSLVYLGRNRLTYLPQQLLNWGQVEELQLAGNPWDCSCELSWLSAVLVNSSWGEEALCLTPSSLQGVQISKAGEAISCSSILELGSVVMMAVIVVSISVSFALCYVLARRQFPHVLPELHLFGRSTPEVTTGAKYLPLIDLSVISGLGNLSHLTNRNVANTTYIPTHL